MSESETSRHRPPVLSPSSRDSYQAVFNAALDGLIVIALDRKIAELNPAACQMHGYVRHELLGMDIRRLIYPEDHYLFEEFVRTVTAGQPFRCQGRGVRKDRSLFELEVHGSIISFQDQPHLLAVIREITELKKAQQSLAETGQLLRTLIDHAPEAIVLLDADTGRFVDGNPNAMHLYGLDEKRFAQVGPIELSPPAQPDGQESREAGRRRIAEALAGENPVFEWIHRDTRGREFPCEVRLVRLPVAGRNLIRGSVTDISDRRKVEQELRESESRIRLLMESTAEAIFGLDLNGHCTFCNPACLRALRYDNAEQLMNRRMHDVIHHRREDGSPFPFSECPISETLRHGDRTHRSDEVLWRADGSCFPAEYWAYPVRRDDQLVGAVVTFLDIADRRRAEHALQQAQNELEDRVRRRTTELARSEERWRSLVATAPDLILIINADGTIRYINRTVQGFQLENVIGRKAADFLCAESRPAMAEALRTVLDTGDVCSIEVASSGLDGNVEWYASRLGPFYENNRVVGVTSIATNITQHKQAQEATRRLAGIVQAADDAIISALVDGTITSWNEGAQRLLGYRADEAIGQSVSILQPRDASMQLTEVSRAFERGEKLINVETERVHKTGRHIPVSLTISPLRKDEDAVEGFCAILRDITDRKNAEKTIQSERKLLRRLLEIQEQERQMLAHDMHDGFVQYIVGAHMILQSGQRQLEAQKVAIPDALATVSDLLQQAIVEGRRLIGDLRPMVIDERGFLEAVRHLIADAESHFGLHVTLMARVDFDRLDPKLEGTMFRIVQEALTNIRRHGQTDQAQVRVRQYHSTVRIEVQDYGVGFEPDTVPAERFGLRGIKERARLFGGQAWITSRPGGGTLVVAEMPCIPQDDSA